MVKEHYRNLLSKHYTWMSGLSFEEKVREQKALLSEAIGALKQNSAKALAVDLGSGPGFQTVALAELGFAPVVAIDSSAELLGELRSHAKGLAVEIREADLLELPAIIQTGEAAVVVCMGDTLTHLTDKVHVSRLFSAAFDVLCSGGLFIVTYRDLTPELEGSDRFIPVRSDDKTIMTCFLEYQGSESVVVHDLVYTREVNGWTLNKSSYRKLRLGVEWTAKELASAGFVIEFQGAAGRLSEIVAGKP